jgi:cell division septum initiation protein DivIVA
MDILELVDRLDGLVNEGWRVPLSTKTVIDEGAFFDIIDQMRVSIPQEVKQASELLQDRENALAAARKSAEHIVEEAQARAASILDEHDIIAAARAEAESIKAQAQREAQEIRKGADDYAIGVLGELESRLSALLRTSSNGLAALRRRRRHRVSEEPEEPLGETASALD